MLITDSHLFPYRPLDVRAYLAAIHSPRVTDCPDFADYIEDASRLHDINPRWLLLTAEKEQSFLTRRGGGDGWARALAYTMGYGATDGHDIPKYAGTKQQVFSAAEGLRHYLTPGIWLYVGGLVGKTVTDHGESYTLETLAEAAQYQYTPWVRYLRDNPAVWNRLEAKAPELWNATGGRKTMTNPADIAEQIVAARRRGDTAPVLNGVRFDTEEKGYCSRFVRLCHEAAGLPAGVFGCCAHSTTDHLRGAGKAVSGPVRGGIVTFGLSAPTCSTCGQTVNHIGICLGGGLVAENTSSGQRGDPRKAGTKISRLEDIGVNRVTGYWSLLPGAAPVKPDAYKDGPITVKVADKPHPGELRVGTSYLGDMPVREFEEVGGAVYDHVPGERTVYVYKAKA